MKTTEIVQLLAILGSSYVIVKSGLVAKIRNL
jgi:hypothetical protein